jgi:hypothetical protein
VVRRGELTSLIKETDTAATVLWTLGLCLFSGCAGAVVQGPFAAP